MIMMMMMMKVVMANIYSMSTLGQTPQVGDIIIFTKILLSEWYYDFHFFRKEN